jgi:hypothetical protein
MLVEALTSCHLTRFTHSAPTCLAAPLLHRSSIVAARPCRCRASPGPRRGRCRRRGNELSATVLRDLWALSRSTGVWERLNVPNLEFTACGTMRFTASSDSYFWPRNQGYESDHNPGKTGRHITGAHLGVGGLADLGGLCGAFLGQSALAGGVFEPQKGHLETSEVLTGYTPQVLYAPTSLPICSSQAAFRCGRTRLVCRQAVTTSWPRSPMDTARPVDTARCLSS